MSKVVMLLMGVVVSIITSSASPAHGTERTTSMSTGGSSSGDLPRGAAISSPSSAQTSGSRFLRQSASSGSSSSSATVERSTSTGVVIPGTTIPSSVTHLVVSNKTASAVTIGLQCQLAGPIVQDGCTTNISDMAIIDITAGGTPQSFTTFSSSQGTLALASMHQYEIVNLKTNPFSSPANQQQNCLQGLIISFGQWNSCPASPGPAFPIPFVAGPAIPNGSNAAEPSLNLPSTIGGSPIPGTGATEVCDITCVNGANSILKLTITSPSQPPTGGSQALPWAYDASSTIGAGQSFSTTNSWVNVSGQCDDNCYKIVNGNKVDRPGVFPYGCSQCNIFPDPGPPCGQFCAAQNGLPANKGCTFNRAPQTANAVTSQFGGTVEFSYLSKAVPPASCQNLGQP